MSAPTDPLIVALRAKESLGHRLTVVECMAWLRLIGPSTIKDLSRRWNRDRRFVRRLVSQTRSDDGWTATAGGAPRINTPPAVGPLTMRNFRPEDAYGLSEELGRTRFGPPKMTPLDQGYISDIASILHPESTRDATPEEAELESFDSALGNILGF